MAKTKVMENELVDKRLMEFIVPKNKVEKDYQPGTIYHVDGKTEDYLVVIFQNSYEQQQVLGFPIYRAEKYQNGAAYVDTDAPEKVILPEVDKIKLDDDCKMFIDFGRVHTLSYRYIGQYVGDIRQYYNEYILPKYGNYTHSTDEIKRAYDTFCDLHNTQVNALKTKIEEQATKIIDYSKKVSYLTKRNETMKEKTKGLKDEISVMTSNMNKSEKDSIFEIAEYKSQIERLKKSLAEADEKIKNLGEDRFDELEMTIKQLQFDIDDKQRTIEMHIENNECLYSENEKLRKELDMLKKEQESAEQPILQDDLGYYKGKSEAYELVIKALMAKLEG